jgi:hypothetical protein
LTVIDPLEPKLVGIDETQFLNWPAVQFSRSGRGATAGDSGGRSLKTQQCSCAGPKARLGAGARMRDGKCTTRFGRHS